MQKPYEGPKRAGSGIDPGLRSPELILLAVVRQFLLQSRRIVYGRPGSCWINSELIDRLMSVLYVFISLDRKRASYVIRARRKRGAAAPGGGGRESMAARFFLIYLATCRCGLIDHLVVSPFAAAAAAAYHHVSKQA